MAQHSKRGPPLPAPTDTSSNSGVGASGGGAGAGAAYEGALDGTELSRVTDQSDQTSYSIPEDGSPVTIPTHRRRGDGGAGGADRISRENHPSQTSLLIEYFEGGKESQVETRRPSVRVKVTPSGGKSKGRSGNNGGHIQITKSRSGGKEEKEGGRKPSYTKRIHLSSSGGNTKSARLIDLEGDGQSLSSYASATEESNVSRNPIEIEVGPRRHRSPLIPDPDAPIREQVLGSDVSSMPANSFLDGDSGLRSERGSRGFSKNEALISGAAAGLGAAALGEALKAPTRRRSRSLSRERIITQKAAEKVRSAKSEHRHKHSRDRSVSDNAKRTEKHSEVSGGSPRRRSSRGHHDDSLLSGESSLLTSSKLSERSHRSAASGKSSITNPKLLETVEDAIRRLILPELNALKKENASRDKYEREQRSPRHRRSSLTSSSALSQESRDGEPRSKRTSAGETSLKSKLGDERDRAVSGGTVRPSKSRRSSRGGSESPRPHTPRTPRSADRGMGEDSASRQKRSGEKKSAFGALAAGIGLGALAGGLKGHSAQEEKDYDDKERAERRRRRARSRSRGDEVESFDRAEEEVPPMPMMSEVNASDITRSSILSASTERPRSAAGEKEGTPVRDVERGFGSPYGGQGQRGLGMKHHNGSTPDVSRMDLRMGEGEYDLDEYGRKVPLNRSVDGSAYDQQAYHDDLDANKGGYGKAAAAAVGGGALGVLAANAMAHHNQAPSPHHEDDSRYLDEEDDDAYYAHTQHDIPSPLKYVPYNQEKRGLSPIQSVSGYTEADEQERLQKQRDSRATMTQSSRSRGSLASTSLDQSPAHKAASVRSDGVLGVDPRSFDFRDVRMGGLTDSELTQEGDLDHDADADADAASEAEYQRHRSAAFEGGDWAGANPDYIHTPVAVESAVASLLDASVLTGHTGEPSPALEGGYEAHLGDGKAAAGVNRQASYASYDEGSERLFTARGISPAAAAAAASPGVRDLGATGGGHAVDSYPEYELDDQGRKITMPDYKNHNHGKDAAIAGIVGAAAGTAATMLVNRHEVPEQHYAQQQGHDQIPGAPLQKSFKDRARDYIPPSPRRGDMYMDSDEESSRAKMSANAAPGMGDPVDPMFAEDASVTTNPSVINGPSEPYSPGGDREVHQQQGDRDWYYKTPPPTRKAVGSAASGSGSGSGLLRGADSDSGLRAAQMGLLDAAPLGAKAHTRDQSLDEEWHRTSDERKRDTLITNPYEGSSPVTLLGGEKDRNLLGQLGYEGVRQNLGESGGYNTGSPVGGGAVPKDEGYISSAPNARSPGVVTPEPKRGGGVVGFTDEVGRGPGEFEAGGDPFYTPGRHQRQLSGMSQGMESPLYDGAMGRHREAIKSKDIVALMDHLTVRDAQRNARDTEILVTLVRAAAEMRNSFEDMKRLLADTEDVVITEVQRNTEKSVMKAINGPRPLPQSVKSLRSGTGDDDDLPTKRRNVFKRALKGLSMRSTNDLAQIERMLVQLLGDVEGLKVAQGLSSVAQGGNFDDDDYDDAHQEGAAEQDRGYEPEGHAGTTTASHASQSGHFSNPLSRGTSASQGFGGRKFSENRVSTVPEGDEDDNLLDYREQAILDNAYDNAEPLSPLDHNPRAGSAPLGTPPQRVEAANLSNENTPRTATDKSKKHKSSSSFGWNPIPKISRWSETTASTVAKGFRSSGGRKDAAPNSPHTTSHPPSRSGSDLGNYDHDPYGGDKLHSGFSAATLPLQQSADSFAQQQQQQQRSQQEQQPHPDDADLSSLVPPEDPKYKAHRNSLNLQHPQPRTGHHYQGTLEREAVDFRGMGSPRSVDWGSTTSLDRLPQNANVNRYSNGTTGTEDSQNQGGHHHYADQDPGPARPPKEPLDSSPSGSQQAQYPPKPAVRGGKLTKPSPLATEQRADYGTGVNNEDDRRSVSESSEARTYEGSPRAVHRSVSGLAAVPTRKPTGPRSMGSPRGAGGPGVGGGSGAGGEGGKRGESSPSPGPGGEYRYW